MSEARPAIFPNLSSPVEQPAWARAGSDADIDAELLVDRLQGVSPNKDRAARAAAALQGQQARLLDGEDKPISQFPPPPSLGNLVPGGRSNPPPANDVASQVLDERSRAFADAALELAIARASTLAGMEGQLLDLAIEVAAAVIEREVQGRPELHAVLARAALQSLGDSSYVTLRVSEEALAAITQAFGGHEIEVRGVHVQIVADPSLPGLGCVVDGEHVRIDATVGERLRAVRRAFEDERRRTVESHE